MSFHPAPLLNTTLGSAFQIITLTLDALGRECDLPGKVVAVHARCEWPETAKALACLKADRPLTSP